MIFSPYAERYGFSPAYPHHTEVHRYELTHAFNRQHKIDITFVTRINWSITVRRLWRMTESPPRYGCCSWRRQNPSQFVRCLRNCTKMLSIPRDDAWKLALVICVTVGYWCADEGWALPSCCSFSTQPLIVFWSLSALLCKHVCKQFRTLEEGSQHAAVCRFPFQRTKEANEQLTLVRLTLLLLLLRHLFWF